MNYIQFVISLGIFLFTLFMVIVKPKNIPIGYSALLGALLALVFGILSLHGIEIVWNIVWNATFTFVAIIISSIIFDEAGVFEYAAIKFARFARGNGKRMFVYLILLGAIISAFFANDGTALILTPIVVSLLVRTRISGKAMIPFIIATGFIADSSSIPLVISNLVNIVTSSYFHISFLSYAEAMIFPDLVSIGASIFFLYIYFRKDIQESYETENLSNPEDVIKDPLVFKLFIPVIFLLIVGNSIGGIYDIPVAFISVPLVAALAIISKLKGKVDVKKAVKEAPWQIVIFSLGMYMVVYAFGSNGFTSIMVYLIQATMFLPYPIHLLLSGYLFAAIAATMNNMPSTLLASLAIGQIHNGLTLAYASVIANDIGPKFTPIGSLATLLWLYTLQKKRGIDIKPLYYMKTGFIIGFPVLTITLLSLLLPL
ncbi:MAG: arsenical efflux pump membrane protein ArsB [Candidatus Thermoplasmatota archaeon]|nr:arsenical efflux pump membrane protein ArsB [Candidatus Thermoplasmatota archaeon]